MLILFINRKKILETGRDMIVLLAPFSKRAGRMERLEFSTGIYFIGKIHSMKFVPFIVSLV